MMYEVLTYINDRGEKVRLAVDSVYHCNVSTDVDGISNVKNTVYKTSSMGQNGESYNGQKIEAKDIDIHGAINTMDKERAYELRRKLIKILNPEIGGRLVYEFGEFKRVIRCRVSGEVKPYRKNLFVQFGIPLECLDPFWREETEQKQDIASWIPCLEFPVEIPDDEGMEFAYREPNVIVDVYNEGDVQTGMRIEFRATATLHNPILLNVETREFIKINAEMKAGDIVTVETGYGKKGATLYRDGVTVDFYRKLDTDSTFMQLEVGDNIFRYDADDGVDMLEVSIYHDNGYLGV